MTAPLKEGWLILWMLVLWRGAGEGVLWLYVQRFIKPPKVNTISSSDIPCHFSPDHGLLFFILHRGSFFNLQNEAEETEESRTRGGVGGVRCGLVDRKTFVSLCNVTFNQFYLH